MLDKQYSSKRIDLKKLLFQWETFLLLIFLLLTVVNSLLSEYYFDIKNLILATAIFMDKAIIVLPMVMVLILGDIDISVASILALSSVIMGVTYNAGVPMPVAIFFCVLSASLCGFINGLLITKFKELSSVIITLSTMIIYRGITYVMLEDRAAGNFPTWFSALGWNDIYGIPYSLIIFIILAVFITILLHTTILGRNIYAIGINSVASVFSGIKVNSVKIIVFTLMGFFVGISSLILTSRLGSTKPNIATGYELDIITTVILGGISAYGGKGKMTGAIIAVFLIGYLRYGLGLINVNAQIFLIIIGALLIFAVMLPNLTNNIRDAISFRKEVKK